MARAHRTGILLIVAAALLWSSGGIGIKAISEAPLKVAFYRSLFATAALFALFRRQTLPSSGWTFRPSFVVAMLSYATCLTTFVIATKWTTAANAIFIQYAGVIWVLILAPFILREPFRSRDAVAIGVAFCGMALFFVGHFEARGMAGNAMAVVSSIAFASLVLALRRQPKASEAAIAWGNVLTTVAIFPFILHDLGLSSRSMILLALMGVFQIAAAYALFVRGLRHVSATQASLTGMIEPVANPIWVFLFMGERPGVWALAGGAIVLLAVAWRTITGAMEVAELPPPD